MEYTFTRTQSRRTQHLAKDTSDLPGEGGAICEGLLGTLGLEGWVGQEQAVIDDGKHRQFAISPRG